MAKVVRRSACGQQFFHRGVFESCSLHGFPSGVKRFGLARAIHLSVIIITGLNRFFKGFF